MLSVLRIGRLSTEMLVTRVRPAAAPRMDPIRWGTPGVKPTVDPRGVTVTTTPDPVGNPAPTDPDDVPEVPTPGVPAGPQTTDPEAPHE